MRYFETRPEKIYAIQVTMEAVAEGAIGNIYPLAVTPEGNITDSSGNIIPAGAYIAINRDTGLVKIMSQTDFEDRYVEVTPPCYSFPEILPMLRSGRKFSDGSEEVSYMSGEIEALVKKIGDKCSLFIPEASELVSDDKVWTEVV